MLESREDYARLVDGAFIDAVQNRILLLTGRRVSREEAVVWAVEYVAIMPQVVDLPWNRSDRVKIARRVSHGVNSNSLEKVNALLEKTHFIGELEIGEGVEELTSRNPSKNY